MMNRVVFFLPSIDERLQFAFSQLDPKDHSRVFFFTIKIENKKYNGKVLIVSF